VGDETVIPGYWHVGAEVAMVSGPDAGKDAPYRFGDYVRPSLDARLALGERFELAGGVSLPPKRSEVTDVPTIMGGFLLARLSLGPRSSLFTEVFSERLLPLLRPRDDGAWVSTAVGLDAREFVDRDRRWLAFAGNLGASGGRAVAAGGDQFPWLIEVQAGGAVHLMFMDRHDGDGVGLAGGVDFAFPAAHGGRAFWVPGAPEVRPQTRANFFAAAYTTLATGWDITLKVVWLERGDASVPETVLPVLTGGFDQRQLVFGVTYRGRPAPRAIEPIR
jgi:hypothetical protein